MKIKKLIIENINSLYGHFEINFEAKDFSSGIFAITGPTGSGKTTIERRGSSCKSSGKGG